MDRLRADRIVVSDTLAFEPYDGGTRLRGRVRTESGGVLDVRKVLRPAGRADEADPRVRTVAYRYQAVWQPRAGASVPLFRYDNYREDVNTLHRHDFDADGNETARYPGPPRPTALHGRGHPRDGRTGAAEDGSSVAVAGGPLSLAPPR